MEPVGQPGSLPKLTAIDRPNRLRKKYPASQAAAASADEFDAHNATLHGALVHALSQAPTDPTWRGAFYTTMCASIADLDAYAAKRYGAQVGGRCLQKLRDLRPNCESLVVDPGLVQRLDAFCAFVWMHPCASASDARARFSAQCGQRTVLRGLALLPAEALAIASTGMLCRGNTQLSWGTHGPLDDVWRAHVLAGTKQSPFLSATLDQNVAVSVSTKSRTYNEQKIYLFTLRIPELDSISLPDKVAGYRSVGFADEVETLIALGVHGSEIVGFTEAILPSNASSSAGARAQAKGKHNVAGWFKRR